MSDINFLEKQKLEKLFMHGGYVLDFSNHTFQEFVSDAARLNIYADVYLDELGGSSKGKRLKTFLTKESNLVAGTLIEKLIEYFDSIPVDENYFYRKPENPELVEECKRIAARLKQDTGIQHTEVLEERIQHQDYRQLARSVLEYIRRNEPESALDRLHTIMVKYITELLTKHNVSFTDSEPLNAIYGKYIKQLTNEKLIESVMTEKILKYGVMLMDAFNDIRNNRSLAHPNQLLNYNESVLICNNVLNSIKFIQIIEEDIDKINKSKNQEIKSDDLPF